MDTALIAREPLRDIAKRYGTSSSALQRHGDAHLPAHLVKAREADECISAGGLLAEVEALKTRGLQILAKAERAGDHRTALIGIREVRGVLELLAKLTDQAGSPRVTLNLSSEEIGAMSIPELESLLAGMEARFGVRPLRTSGIAAWPPPTSPEKC